MNVLHSDLLKYIFAFLGDVNRIVGRFVCRRWNGLFKKRPRYGLESFTSSLSLFSWAFRNKCPMSHFQLCIKNAIMNDRLDVLQFIEDNNASKGRWSSGHLVTAARHGRLEIVKWLLPRLSDPSSGKSSLYLYSGALLVTVIFLFSSGLARMDVHGIHGRLLKQLNEGISRCYSGSINKMMAVGHNMCLTLQLGMVSSEF